MALAFELDYKGNVMDFETIDVADTALTLTAAEYRKNTGDTPYRRHATCALISVDGAVATDGIRVTFDGTAPVSATTGHLVVSREHFIVKGQSKIAKLRMIREGSNSVKVHVTYFE